MYHLKIIVALAVLLNSLVVQADILRDLSKPPEFLNARISPTGDYLAILKEEDQKRVLAVFEYPKMKLINVVDFPGRNEVGAYWWVNDERLLMSVLVDWGNREEEVGYGELYAVNADGKKGKYLFGHRGEQGAATKSRVAKVKAEFASATLEHPRWQDPKNVLISYVEWNRGFKRVTVAAKLDVYTGRLTEEINAPTANAEMIADANGEIRFSSYRDDNNKSFLYLRNVDTGEWSEFSSADYGESQISPVHLDADGDLYVRQSQGDGPAGLYLIDAETRKKKKLYHHQLVDYMNLLRDHTGEVYGVVSMPDKYEQAFFSADHPNAQLRAGLADAFPNGYASIVSQTHDFRLSIVAVESDIKTLEYFIYDRENGSLAPLMDRSPWIDDEVLSPMEPIMVTARDGVELHGYLTVPRGAQKKNLPLVIVPHGGPHGPRDQWGYQWFEGFLPASGYAILQINYRGSGGYGTAFENMGHQKWHTTMQDDLTDSVRWAIDQGIADPDRVCIFGWSYGGYAAAMSISREPDLYKCAVAGAGVYDQVVQYNEADFTDFTRWGKKYLQTAVGETPEVRWQASPIAHVDKIKTPLLLIHGEDDLRVPIEHAYNMRKAMKKAGKPVPKLIELRNEAHTPRKEENIYEYYNETVKFIEQHIGPGVKPKRGA